ncbi:MAG: hypothetical protein AB1726_16590 [Planctomycetota bacterium]
MDLTLPPRRRQLGVECKRHDAPGLAKSNRLAIDDLGLERVAGPYPGALWFALGDRMEAAPLHLLADPAWLLEEDPG